MRVWHAANVHLIHIVCILNTMTANGQKIEWTSQLKKIWVKLKFIYAKLGTTRNAFGIAIKMPMRILYMTIYLLFLYDVNIFRKFPLNLAAHLFFFFPFSFSFSCCVLFLVFLVYLNVPDRHRVSAQMKLHIMIFCVCVYFSDSNFKRM